MALDLDSKSLELVLVPAVCLVPAVQYRADLAGFALAFHGDCAASAQGSTGAAGKLRHRKFFARRSCVQAHAQSQLLLFEVGRPHGTILQDTFASLILQESHCSRHSEPSFPA